MWNQIYKTNPSNEGQEFWRRSWRAGQHNPTFVFRDYGENQEGNQLRHPITCVRSRECIQCFPFRCAR